MYPIVFQTEGGGEFKLSAAPGENLLELARRCGVVIDAPCSGNGSCGKCRVRLLSGSLVSEPSSHLSEEEFAAGWRLACQCRISDGGATVLVPKVASAFQSHMKISDLSNADEIALFDQTEQALADAGLRFISPVRVCTLSLPAPTLDDAMPDAERFSRAVCASLSLPRVELPFPVLQRLPDLLRENDFSVRCVVANDTILDVLPAASDCPVCGVAVDIGTTSVTGVLIELTGGRILAKASAGNGQIRYGADVINRIVEQGKPGGVERLQSAVLDDTLLPMLRRLCKNAHVPESSVYRVCLAGNTTMEHLLLGVNANPLRTEPYVPAFFFTDPIPAAALRLPVNGQARVVLAPNIGSYVGGDITAGTLVSRIWHDEALSLFIDLGTNGELVFGGDSFLMSCACSAGPAFEGGDITCGMRATDGAVEAVSIDRDTLIPRLTVIGPAGTKPAGICGSGIIDSISELFRCGVIDAKGRFIRENDRVHHDEHGSGRYLLCTPEEAASERGVFITDVDIDNFIRAKGAIFSAIQTMLHALELDVSAIDRVLVAGGIGSGINMANAVRIGMFPDVPLEKFHYIGNSSLAGAYAMLMSADANQKLAELARNTTYLELSAEPRYMEAFVAACFLPHTDASLFPSAMEEA